MSEFDKQNYNLIKFLRDRLTTLVMQLRLDELTFLLFRFGSQEVLKERVHECTNVLR